MKNLDVQGDFKRFNTHLKYYRACPKCAGGLDLDADGWVADFPGRESHGYRISQLFSSKVDAGEILREYRRTRFPERRGLLY